METADAERLMAMLRAYGVALSALLATHPQPSQLRQAFEHMAHSALSEHPMYHQTLETLRRSIS